MNNEPSLFVIVYVTFGFSMKKDVLVRITQSYSTKYGSRYA